MIKSLIVIILLSIILVSSQAQKIIEHSNDGSLRTNVQYGEGFWVLELEDTWLQAPLLVEDLNMDGQCEIAVQGFWEEYVYLVNNDGTYAEGWPKKIGLSNASPVSGNLDEDDDLEIIFATDRNGLHAFNYDGTYVEGWPVDLYWLSSNGGKRKKHFWNSPTLYDLNNDGKLEILAPGYAPGDINEEDIFELSILDNTGQVIYLDNPLFLNNKVLASVAVGDINNDNTNEIIAVGKFGTIYAWNIYGEPIEHWPSTIIADSISRYVAPVLGDINGDGNKEIIIAKSNSQRASLYAIDFMGNILDNWPKLTSSIWEPPALADMDDDGSLDIVLNTGRKNKIYVFNYLGEEIKRFSKEIGSKHSPLIADLDNDGKLDIIAVGEIDSSTGYGIFAWDNNGVILSGFPIQTKTLGSSPVIGDFDNDEMIEIVFAVRNSDVEPSVLYYWNLENIINESLTVWPTYRHDNWGTGCYGTLTSPTEIHGDELYETDLLDIRHYSDFVTNNTIVELNITEAGHYNCTIYDILGRKISTVFEGIWDQGRQNLTVNGSNLSAGVYILSINSNTVNTAMKIIITK